MKKALCISLCCALSGLADTRIPEGTKVRVRLEQAISSATAEQGQTVELVTADPIVVSGVTVIAEGARVSGTVTEAHEKRRMGRAGKLDFSIDRVKAMDDHWISLRYSLNKKTGGSEAVKTGILTAGVALVFWPAAPVLLLLKGKDVTINKGVTFDVFTDSDYTYKRPEPQPLLSAQSQSSDIATVALTSTTAGADIEVDGAFVGNTPTTLTLAAGQHRVIIRAGSQNWDKTVQIRPGSSITLSASFNR